MFGIGNRLADHDVLDAGQADDVARGCFRHVHALEALEREQLRDAGRLDAAVQLADANRIADLSRGH